MDAIDLLKEFAKTNGIDVSKVDEFLKSFGEPKTLEELMKLPHDMLNHVSYITYLDEPLQSFIADKMWAERYMTIELDEVVDCLLDRKWDLVRDYTDSNVDFDDIDFDDVREKLDEEKLEQLEELEKIEKNIIETKFGSVVYDW